MVDRNAEEWNCGSEVSIPKQKSVLRPLGSPRFAPTLWQCPPDVVVKELVEKCLNTTDASPEQEHCEHGISLLIEADNYWDVIAGNNKRISGLVTIKNIFGWTSQEPTGLTTSTILSSSITGMMRVTVAMKVYTENYPHHFEASGN